MSVSSVRIAGIYIDQVEETETAKRENTESLMQSVSKNFLNGMVTGAIGQIIPRLTPAQAEMPNTKTNIARLNGIKSEDAIVLTSNKTETVVSSCWRGGFSHPIDFHYHHPSYEEYTGEKPGGRNLA
jgi:hypothetical protein